MKFFKLLLLVILFTFAYSGTVYAQEILDCTKCHGNTVSDFEAASVQRATVCWSCHRSGGHAYYIDKNGYMRYAQLISGYGYFFTPQSPQATAPVLHNVHSGQNAWATNSKCNRCHGTISCSSCHTSVSHILHSTTKYTLPSILQADGVTYTRRSVSCAGSLCHSPLPNVVTVRRDGKELCINCHSVDSSGHKNVSDKHLSGFVSNAPYNCGECHDQALNLEHEARKDTDGEAYNCYTCHNSDRPEVQAAISNNIKRCDTCHGLTNHDVIHASLQGEVPNIDSYCQSCHTDLLTAEHLANPKTQAGNSWTCGTCHKSNTVSVTGAIQQGKKDCTNCHTAGHGVVFANKLPADIPQYPGYDWSVPQDTLIWSNEDWMPAEFREQGRIMVSSRKNLQVSDLRAFYEEQLNLQSWTIGGIDQVGENLRIEAAKGIRQLVILAYRTEEYNSGAIVGTGYRIKLIYS